MIRVSAALLILAAACPMGRTTETAARKTSAIYEATTRAAASTPSPNVAFDAARARLDSSLQQLRQFLATGGIQKQTRWAQWLELPALEAQLTANPPDITELNRHLERLHQDQHGLELPAFVAVRQELRHYLTASEYLTSNAPRVLYRRRLEELSDCLTRLDAAPTIQDAHQAGQLVAWLESFGGESDQLAAAVRQQYCRTNALLRISSRLTNVLLERNVETQQFIAENILGSYTQGTAFTRARVSFDFLPSQSHATFILRMNGQAISPENVAQRRRITVFTSAGTTISAEKPVYLDANGLHLSPAAASCTTSAQINDIDARRRIVERLASRRAGRMMPQAEQATSQRAQTLASSKLDEQAAKALAGLNNLIRYQIRAPLIRHDALPKDWVFSTDRDYLRISAAQHNDAQLAVATPVPEFSSSYDGVVAAHDSMLVNLGGAMLGGETIKDHWWLEFSKQLSGNPPPALWIRDGVDRWSITLEKTLPILANFSDDRIIFTLRIASFTRGKVILQHPLEIEARFIPRSIRNGPALARDGDLAIRFTTPTEPPDWQATQAFLLQKFDAVFPPRLEFHGMSPPAGGCLGKLNNLVRLAEFKSTGGWLTIAYELRNFYQLDTLAKNNSSSPSLRPLRNSASLR